MRIKLKKMVISLAIIIIVIGIYRVVRHHYALTEPIYYRHLINHYLPVVADSVVETSTIELNYITDSRDERKIIKIGFIEQPNINVTVMGENLMKYGIYHNKVITLLLEWDSYNTGMTDEILEVNTLLVEYSDNSVDTVDIGEICIYGGEHSDNLLEAVDAISLWQNYRLQVYEAKEDLVLIGFPYITTRLMNEMDIIEYATINGIDYRLITLDNAISIQKHKQVSFEMILRTTWEEELLNFATDYDYYKIKPQLVFMDESGEKQFVSIMNFPKFITFENLFDVIKYLKVRGAI